MSTPTQFAEPSRPPRYGVWDRRGRTRDRTKRRTVTMPERVGPHVKLVFAEMARLHITYDELEIGSGVRRSSVKAWRRKNRPGLESLEAVLGFLGWDFIPTPAIKTLSPHIAADLAALAAKMKSDMALTWSAVVAIGIEQEIRRMSAIERRVSLEDCIAHAPAPASSRRKHKPTVN